MAAARDKITGVTQQQEQFCIWLASGLSQSDAYRKAYPKSLNWKDSAVHGQASILARDRRVMDRTAELRAPTVAKMQKKLAYGLEQAMAEAAEALEICRAKENAGAMVSAVTLRAKLNNLLVEQKNIRVSVFDEMDHGQLLEIEDKLRAIANAGIGSQATH